jgi:hypothetical protein
MDQKINGKFTRREILQLMGLTSVAVAFPQIAEVPAMSENTSKSINDLIDEVISLIRDLSKSQVELWRKVPALALEANGKSGYSADLKLAYAKRLWTLNSNNHYGELQLFVDLDTGELVDYKRNPSKRDAVIKLAFSLDQIDAQKQIDWLTKVAVGPTFYAYDVGEQAKWRAEERKWYNVPELKL